MRTPLSAFFLTALLLGVVHAQEPNGADPDQEETVSIAVIDSQLTTLESLELEESEKEPVRKVYQQAKDLVLQVEGADARRRSFAQAAAEAPSLLEQVRLDLAKPGDDPEAAVERGLPSGELEARLQGAEAQLKTFNEQLDMLRTEAQRRTTRRSELAELIAKAEARQREAQEGLLAAAPDDLSRYLLLARRTLLRSQLLHAKVEGEALSAEQESYKARAELLPARADLARQRVARQGALVEVLRKRLADVRRAEASQATDEARALRFDAAVQLVPLLRGVADENEDLARERSAEGGLAERIERAADTLAATRAQLGALRDRFFTIRRKMEAAGLTNAMARLLRKEYEALPDVSDIERRHSLFRAELSEIQLRQIQLEETREDAVAIEDAVRQILADPGIATHGLDRTDVETAARKVLSSRLETVNVLLRDYQAYLERLVEIGLAERKLAAASTATRAYIEERILWVRSVTGSALPNPVEAAEAAAWLVSPSLVQEALTTARDDAWANLGETVLTLFLLVLVLGGAAYGRRHWGKGSGISFQRTVRMLLWTVVVALPPGLILLALGWFLESPPGQSEWGVAVGSGLVAGAQVVLGMSLLWHLASKNGLAAQQFHWDAGALAHLRRHLVWFVPLVIPCVVIPVTLDQQELVARSESLGRIAFVIAQLALALMAQRFLREGSPVFAKGQATASTSLLFRLRRFWLVLLVGSPLALAVLALWGYYYTALRLTRSVEISFLFVSGLVLVRALILRWFLITRRRLAREQAQRRSSQLPRPEAGDESEAAASTPPPEVTPEEQLDLAAIKEQIDKLIRSGMVVAAALGLLWIWGDALPALKRLDQVQLYPHLEILATPDPVLPEALASLAGAESPDGTSAPAATLPGPTGALAAGSSSGEGGGIGRITMGDLLLALLLFGATLAASRNVPGLLEIALLQHLPVDAGARYAVITMVRYMIVIVGGWLTAGAIGITWSSIQWLAAALTFGLAFGLQEIFANFVSGLILFAERPVNVGDVVTVDGVTGKVTRIRIRAVTIVDLDRKELVVPNRVFVTGQIVNWTLSDHVLRLVLNIGVAYGTDATRVTELLLRVARDHPKVLADPPATAFFTGFGDSSLNFDLRVFVTGFDSLHPVKDEVLKAVQRALREEGIEVPFPQTDLHLRSSDGLRELTLSAGRGDPGPPAEVKPDPKP